MCPGSAREQARAAHKWPARPEAQPAPRAPPELESPGQGEFHFFVFCKTRTGQSGRARGVGLAAADSVNKTKPVPNVFVQIVQR